MVGVEADSPVHIYILQVHTPLVHVNIPECDVPNWVLVAMVTDHTRPFPDIPEANCAVC